MPKLSLTRPAPPLPRTYWVIDGKLLAGAYAGQPDAEAQAKRLQGLFDAGVRTIVSLMEEDETNNAGKPFRPYAEDFQKIAAKAKDTVACLRFPIVDQSITTVEHMTEIVNAIDESLQKGRPVYVHCFGGIGRTGTVVCCWLLRHGHATVDNVLDVLKQLRQADTERASRDAPENKEQRDFVKDWSRAQATAAAPTLADQAMAAPTPAGSDWFSRLVGFAEHERVDVRAYLSVDGTKLTSRVNLAEYQCGALELASLGSLRDKVASLPATGGLRIAELVGDARALHADLSNAGALFQVASQFNLLEMISPTNTPEQGVAIYESDATQGPACAIACGAGTIYRNYFVELDGQDGQTQYGQTKERQVDCLADVGDALGNAHGRLWQMRNGYALPNQRGLAEVDEQLRGMSEAALDGLRAKLKIGLQWGTQVTLAAADQLVSDHRVTQAYCSAVPVSYSGLPSQLWEQFARLILEAAYEATLAASVLNAATTGNHAVYLTLLGGGAFGNQLQWILDAIHRACLLFRGHALDVKIVSFRSSHPAVQRLVRSLA